MVTCLHLHFPGGIPVSFLLLLQLCCVSDFALFLSLKCSELSTTKHQRPWQANSDSGSGVRSPTCRTTATPATSCVTCDVLSAFHSDLLSAYTGLFSSQYKADWISPESCFQPFIKSDSFLRYSSYYNQRSLIKRKTGAHGNHSFSRPHTLDS